MDTVSRIMLLPLDKTELNMRNLKENTQLSKILKLQTSSDCKNRLN